MHIEELLMKADKARVGGDGRTKEGKLKLLVDQLVFALRKYQTQLSRAEDTLKEVCQKRYADFSLDDYLDTLSLWPGWDEFEEATRQLLLPYDESVRHYCPLCGSGRQHSVIFEWANESDGFTKEGLSRHLTGSHNSIQCCVVEYFSKRFRQKD